MAGYLTILTGDQHGGSYFGLCPPKVDLEDGGEYRPSKVQRELWKCWLDFWGEMGKVAKANNVLAVNLVFGGDLADMNWHDAGGVMTRHPTTLKTIAGAIVDAAIGKLREAVPKTPHYLFIIRGTPAHVGKKAAIEEAIAEDLSAEPDAQNKTHSWYTLNLVTGGITINVQHHPEAGSFREHTDGGAARTIATEICISHWRNNQKPPDIAVRFHAHRWQESGRNNMPCHAFCCWGWQLATAFSRRKGAGAKILPIGGMYILAENGRYTYDEIHYSVKGQVSTWRQK